MDSRLPLLLTLLLAPALAGCLDAGTEETQAVDAEAADGPAVEDFSFEGDIGTLVTVCAVYCNMVSDGAWDGPREFRKTTALDLVLDWDAADADELGLRLVFDCADGCDTIESVSGPPPVHLRVDGLDASRKHTLYVYHPFECDPVACVAGADVGSAASYTLEGTVTKVA